MFQPYKPNILPPIFLTLLIIVFNAAVLVYFMVFSGQNSFAWGKFILLMMGIAATSTLAVLFTYNYAFKVRKKYFDQTFGVMGLEGKRYLSNSVQYHGKVGGYGVHVYLQPTQRNYPLTLPGDHGADLTFYTGDRLEIFVDYPFKTRMVVASREFTAPNIFDKYTMKPAFNFLKKMATPKDFKEIKISDADYKNYIISGIHESWTKSILSSKQTAQHVKSLLNMKEFMGIKSFTVLPESVKFQIITPIDKINPGTIKKMLDSLIGFVKLAGKNKIKTDLESESDNEHLIRVDRNKFYHKYRFRIFAVFLVLLGLPAILMGLIFWWVIATNTPQ